MNELIIEMAIQAGFNPVNCTGSNVPLFEKFAELIIEECAKISESVTPRHTECGNKIAAKIRQFHGDETEMV
jgi:hypothetical protein